MMAPNHTTGHPSWRASILEWFSSDVAQTDAIRITVVADPDRLLLERELLAIIENNKDRIKIEGGKVEHKIFQAKSNSNFARLFLAPITPYEGGIRITAQ